MVLKRLLDIPRHPLVTRLRTEAGIDERKASEIYWRLLSPFVPNEHTLAVGDRAFEFGISHLPEYYLFEHFDEHDLLADLQSELAPGDVFWDVGANVGVFTVVAAATVGSGTVVAFEPVPQNVRRLRANLSRNGLDAVVDERPLAASAGPVTVELSSDLPGAQGNAIDAFQAADGRAASGTTLSLEATTGDRCGHPSPDVLKLDVEGAEYDVLDGLSETLATGSCRAIYCEVHVDALEETGRSIADLEGLFEEYGYDVHRIGEQFDHRKRWKATRGSDSSCA